MWACHTNFIYHTPEIVMNEIKVLLEKAKIILRKYLSGINNLLSNEKYENEECYEMKWKSEAQSNTFTS